MRGIPAGFQQRKLRKDVSIFAAPTAASRSITMMSKQECEEPGITTRPSPANSALFFKYARITVTAIPSIHHFTFLTFRSIVEDTDHFTVRISSVVTVTSPFDPLSALKTINRVSLNPNVHDLANICRKRTRIQPIFQIQVSFPSQLRFRFRSRFLLKKVVFLLSTGGGTLSTKTSLVFVFLCLLC